MNFVNAIAKVRFSAGKPQRILLHKETSLQADILCLEASQEMPVKNGPWSYYVVTGTASITCGGQTTQVPAGQLAISGDEPHTLANADERRLVCLAIGRAD